LLVYNYPILSLDKDIVKVYINNMETNFCISCGCMPKPDEWADDSNCIDCGTSEE